MKKLSIALVFFSGTCFFLACNGNNSDSEDTGTDTVVSSSANIDTMNNNAGTAMVDEDARNFVKEVAAGGMMEVELGKMAEQKAKSQQVKDFGKMMVEDHSKANDDLRDLASYL